MDYFFLNDGIKLKWSQNKIECFTNIKKMFWHMSLKETTLNINE